MPTALAPLVDWSGFQLLPLEEPEPAATVTTEPPYQGRHRIADGSRASWLTERRARTAANIAGAAICFLSGFLAHWGVM